MKIVFVEPLGLKAERVSQLTDFFASLGHEMVFHSDRQEDEAVLIERMKDAQIVVISNIKLNQKVLSACPSLQMLSVAFTGLDHIDMDYCKANKITVCNASGYATHSTSELSIGLMLDVYRSITPLNDKTRKGGTRNNHLGRELFGKTVGIIGTGAIGSRTAELLLAFGCKVVAWSRTQKKELIDKGITYLSIEELMQCADIISIHIPLNEQTHHLINSQRLSMCKPETILINTARGNIIDMQALANALEQGIIAGAGFDVYEIEPPLPPNHPLLSAPNCILLPHVGYATVEAFEQRVDIVVENIISFLNKKVINKQL